MSNHWILGEIAKSYAQEEREKAMTTEEYDQLLWQARAARRQLDHALGVARSRQLELEALLKRLDTEEHRLAQQALTSMHSASRKLVVGE